MNVLLFLLSTIFFHPVHETVTEIQWNPKSNRYEVALRLHLLDEQWIQTNHGALKTWKIDHVRQHLKLKPKRDTKGTKESRYYWIGRSEEGAHVWWYFEIEPLEKDRPDVNRSVRVANTLFFQREEGFQNRVVILRESDEPLAKVAFTLTIKDSEQFVQFLMP